jgi:hypothetical protein
MISCCIGIPGAGKSFWAVVLALKYLGSGGAVFSNIRLTGLYETGRGGMDGWELAPDSPAVDYLRKNYRWNYVAGRELDGDWVPGQYHYLDLTQWEDDFLKLIPRGSAGKRILLILDEVNEWFDSLDGGKLKSSDKYREMFKFLRLSRHYHIDVVFLLQDFSTLNARLRGLCAEIWKTTDLQKLRVAGVPFPFPFKWFLWQKFDGRGKACVKSLTWPKERAIFACYDSFCEFGAVSLAPGVFKSDFGALGREVKEGVRKMTWLDRACLVLALLGVYLFSRGDSSASVAGAGAVRVVTVTNTVAVASAPVAESSERSLGGVGKPWPVSVKYARISYGCAGERVWAYADGRGYMLGQRHPEGRVVSIERDCIRLVGDGGYETYIYPIEVSPGGSGRLDGAGRVLGGVVSNPEDR